MGKYSTRIALGLLIGLIVYTAWQSAQRRQREQVGLGQVAPPFHIPSLDSSDSDGPQHYPGQVVVLDFWSTYCPPCRRAMPMFQRLYDRYRSQDLVLLSINVNPEDSWGSRVAVVTRFRDDLRLRFPVLVDTGEASRAYGVDSIPHVVVIDRQGVVRYIHISEVAERSLAAEIEELLSRPRDG